MLKSIYITPRFFKLLAVLFVLFVIAYAFPVLLYVTQLALLALVLVTIADIFVLIQVKSPFSVKRNLPERLDLGDGFDVFIEVNNNTIRPFSITLFDELPLEAQERDLKFQREIDAAQVVQLNYLYTPKTRGEHHWGKIHLLFSSSIGLVRSKLVFSLNQKVPVYPSVQLMKKYEFQVFSKKSLSTGIKKIPILGNNNEFEQINTYVQGDDIRRINWKATSRRRSLMVNHYQAERSQNIYTIIDKSRSMERSFDGLTLMDYAINSSLVFSNIALRKGEKVGLFTYSDKMGDQLLAAKGRNQLKSIYELLYKQRTKFNEANFKLLVQTLQRNIRSRSLIMLYTNFETLMSLQRALPLLRLIAKQHVLVVIFFENTQLYEIATKAPVSPRDVYSSTVAQQQMNVKQEMVKLLKANGIYTVLTQPKNLHINAINQYLALKAKGIV